MTQNMLVSMILRLVDEMSGPIKAAEAEVKHLEKTAEQAAQNSQQSNRMSAAEFRALTEGKKVAANNSAAAVERMSAAEFRAMDAAKAHAQEAAFAQRQHTAAVESTTGAFAGMAEQIIATAAAYDTLKIAREAWTQGAEAQHVDIGMQVQGIADAEREAIHQRAAQLTQTYKLFSQTEIEKTIQDFRPVLGTTALAMSSADMALQAATIIKARNPNGNWQDQVRDVFRGMESAGYQKDPEKLRHMLDLVLKGSNAFGDQLSLEKYGQFLRGAGAAAKDFSDEFFLRSLPTFLNEVKDGYSVGQQLSTLSSMIHKGGGGGAVAKELRDLGLIKPDHDTFTKKGDVKGFTAGGIVGGC